MTAAAFIVFASITAALPPITAATQINTFLDLSVLVQPEALNWIIAMIFP